MLLILVYIGYSKQGTAHFFFEKKGQTRESWEFPYLSLLQKDAKLVQPLIKEEFSVVNLLRCTLIQLVPTTD